MTILDSIRMIMPEGTILIFIGVMALGAFICPDSSLASRWGSL